ncbi:MAG: CBS domain-containing protein [Clostridia bacterium]|nr:MAG: CBS domain-containing protein [Clostridia bacterium]
MVVEGQIGNLEVRPLNELSVPYDIFLVGRESPVGPQDVGRLASLLAAEEYSVNRIRQGEIFAAVIRNSLRDRLLPETIISQVIPQIDSTTCTRLLGIRLQGVILHTGASQDEVSRPFVTAGYLIQKQLVTASPRDTVGDASDRMNEHHIGCLPVVQDGRLVGLVTSRDLRRVPPRWLVMDVMSTELVTVSEDTPLWEAQRRMEEADVERVLVVSGEPPELVVAGVLTKADLLRQDGYQKDPLTGLNTSVCLRAAGEMLLGKGQEITIIFIDLNDFGQVNKQYGHVTGDQVLRNVASLLRQVSQAEVDLTCRYGGDEFAVLSTRTGLEARNLAEKLVKGINNLSHPGGISVSACAGVAGGRRSGLRPGVHLAATIDNLINLASKASTLAKKQNLPVLTAAEARAAS